MIEHSAQLPYRVLARKYRPGHFGEVIGQDALIRTLTNAIESGRIAQAYMLTGIRGTGKTTTARLIARALNYTGPDGKGGPTTGPTDDCPVCLSIAEGRHPDVMEMDAASRTGVDDIREILDGVRYAPASARYKIYIIDEVHMLSKAAFNALLKTLEEPPPHVKFIFATTEIRKVPVTVLSRCQRFDLRRVEIPVLEAYYKDICAREGVTAEDAAMAMIARAADGSVRDGLSLLDQAIALGSGAGSGAKGGGIAAAQVQAMLGLADRGRVLDLLEHALKGEVAEGLALMADLYRLGADPDVVMNDLLDLVHLVTRLRVAPKTGDMAAGLSPDAVARALALAGKMSMPTLGRAWQILLKGLAEVNAAPNPQAAAEMVLIRLVYAADLPDPADLLRKLKDHDGGNAATDKMPSSGASRRTAEPVALRAVAGNAAAAVSVSASVPASAPAVHPAAAAGLNGLADVVALFEQGREMLWATQVMQYVHLVRFQPRNIEIRIADGAHPKLPQELGRLLTDLTGERWMVTLSLAPGAPTLAGQRAQDIEDRKNAARANPLVGTVLKLFPGATLDVHSEQKELKS